MSPMTGNRTSTAEKNRALTIGGLGVGMGGLGFAVGGLFDAALIGLAIALVLVLSGIAAWYRR